MDLVLSSSCILVFFQEAWFACFNFFFVFAHLLDPWFHGSRGFLNELLIKILELISMKALRVLFRKEVQHFVWKHYVPRCVACRNFYLSSKLFCTVLHLWGLTLALVSFCFLATLDLGSQGYGDLLACIRDRSIPLDNMHFVVSISLCLCMYGLWLLNMLWLIINWFLYCFSRPSATIWIR